MVKDHEEPAAEERGSRGKMESKHSIWKQRKAGKPGTAALLCNPSKQKSEVEGLPWTTS